MDSTVSIMSLPPEMMLQIMNMLSTPHRGQCKLVCRKWYNLCTVFERGERICIGRMYNDCLNEIMSTLSESARSCFHFEFYGLDLDDDNDTQRMFWQTCGPKILSLKLCYGQLTTHALANILRYCSTLHTLEFYFSSIYDMREAGLSVACLKDCVDLKLQNESLKTLRIYFGDKPISHVCIPPMEDDWSYTYLKSLCYLFHLFPNISNFASHQRDWMSYANRFQGNPRHVDARNAEELIDLLHEYLSRDQMESIAISWLWLNRVDWTSFIAVLSSRTTKITEMTISDSQYPTTESFLELVSRQTNLHTITYILSENEPHHTTDEDFERASINFISLLRNVPTVRRVWLMSHRRHSSTIRSAFRTTDLIVRSIAEKPFARINLSEEEQFPLIEKFTATTIEPNSLPTFDIALLLHYFPNLKDVRLSCLDTAVLETINSKHRNLESLVVKSQAVHGKIPSVTCHFINLFRELKYLEIPETLIFRPLCFNRLKYVHIVRHMKSRPLLTPGFLSNVAVPNPDLAEVQLLPFLKSYQLACPSLEIACMDLECSTITHDPLEKWSFDAEKKWITDALEDFVAELKNLKYLYFNCNYRSFLTRTKPTFTEEDVSCIFERSQSLRVFIIFRQIFFKHAIDGCVRKVLVKNRWSTSERFSEVYEFLEMFWRENKEWWFQDTYFRWFQTI